MNWNRLDKIGPECSKSREPTVARWKQFGNDRDGLVESINPKSNQKIYHRFTQGEEPVTGLYRYPDFNLILSSKN